MDSNILDLILISAGGGGHFDWWYTLKHSFNLLLLLFVLGYILNRPIKNFLVERRGLIANEIDEAKKKIDEAKEMFEKYSEKIGSIESDVNALKESFRTDAEHERKELLEQAEAASKRLKEEAVEIIRMETETAKHQIRQEFVSQAIDAASKILAEKLGKEDEKRFIDDFVKITEEHKWHQ